MSVTRFFRQQLAGATAMTRVPPAWAAGLRGAIATVVPIIVGGALHWPGASWMGLAGFCASTADKGGAYRTRANAMAGVAIFGGLGAMAGSLAGNLPRLGIVLIVLVVTFCTLLRIYGQTAISIGTNVIVTYIVGLAAPCSPREALARGGAIVIGVLWAMLVALALWPIRFYRPARQAIATAFRGIASYARDVARLEDDERRALFTADYNATFAAIEHAREVLAAIRSGRPTESRRGERLLVLLEKADRAFARLTSIAEAAETANIDAEALRRVAEACETIARVVESERNESIATITIGGAPLLLAELVRAVNDAAGTAVGVNSEKARGVFEAHRERDTPLATLRTVLTWRSIVLRHALRVGLVTGVAVWLAAALHLQRGYWVTFSAFIILQPYTTATQRKGLQRIGGTIIGGLLAAVAVALVHSDIGISALIFIGAFVCLALLPINYGLFAIFMTPTFVLLAELGAHDRHLVGLRIVNTLIGCALGFVAARVLWPSSERAVVRDEIAGVIASLADYVRAAIAGDEVRGISARRAAHLALQNADAALQQALSDPDARAGRAEPAMTVIVHGRRFALALSALAVATRGRRHEVQALLESVAVVVETIATSLRTNAPIPPLPPIEATAHESSDALLRQLETLQDAAARFAP